MSAFLYDLAMFAFEKRFFLASEGGARSCIFIHWCFVSHDVPIAFFRHILTVREVRNMRNQTRNRECVAVIGQMTQAMQAQSVLAIAAVRTEVIKADSLPNRRGCAYAISFPCDQMQMVERILQNANIRVQFYQSGGVR